ncbi:amidohydrolase [Nocardia brasiliensis]|uniref:Putative amidohydrolase n=1 Tax=Nocardia brasiliensis (strain ATCC 700358 / HUJEG-1) TaxID=1133849 RepID=K0EZK6_NOCB7|nr:amidohydrolase [Nocardia brasiliensis]AFU02937.1 putative amidohydrolase [Nocardia brasiliensis ATCC 700358]OCF86011.1 amidohydrolase [Nocardia brasiliensis]
MMHVDSDVLADLYKRLHKSPELSLMEFATSALLAEKLRELGIPVTTGVGGTGVVGVLSNGDGPVVMLRADIDALPVEEMTELPYASTERAIDHEGREVPVMHACGHDMHATCLIGAATVLAGTTAEWSGTVVFVFQPAEELLCGAQNMVDDGLFERCPKPDIVLGQHVAPMPAGMTGFSSGPTTAAVSRVRITLHGRGSHGSRPEASIDPVVMAASVVTRLQTIVSREVPPGEVAVVTVGRLDAGTAGNVIPDTAELDVSVRTYDGQIRTRIHASIERIVRAEALASGSVREPEFDWQVEVPAVFNDPEFTAATRAAFADHFGDEAVISMPTVTGSEDFGVFGAVIGAPSVFWFWGGFTLENRKLEDLPANHSSQFAPDIEPTLTTGVQAMVIAARRWLGRSERRLP